MKSKCIEITVFPLIALLLISCKVQQGKAPQEGLKSDSQNILLLGKSRFDYIFLQKDTAFYEYREVKEHPPRFESFDTLTRVDTCFCFRGKKHYLEIGEKSIDLKFINSSYVEKFVVASNKQIQEWNDAKNRDNYSSYLKTVDSLIEKNRSNKDFVNSLQNDWESLGNLIATLDQRAFDLALNNFKTKYLIK